MNRSALVLGASVAACALAMLGARDARACGGCFTPPTQTASDITDERMLLTVSTQQTTLYDQIRYSGNPASFAWVLPIHGTVDVGLSADVLFDSIDAVTATTIVAPPQNCPGPPDSCSQGLGGSFGGASNAAAPGDSAGTVTVTKSQNVGPYATVQLHASDSSALNNWLTTNGFSIPPAVTSVIDQYVAEGFDFLAMKLLPGEGVQSMRPVRVTSPGAGLSLPLRMAAIGTGATVGITIWVVADGRYEPQNFPFFHIEDKDLIWDFSTSSSNYTTLRAQNEANLVGKGWEMESSLSLSQQLISNVILSGGQYFQGGGVSGGAPSSASDDYLPIGDPDAGTDSDGGAVNESADQVRAADIAALFAGISGPNVRVTRMRSDISHAAMTTDFVLQASSDQSEMPNQRVVTQSVNLSCPIYDNCQVVGYGSLAQAQAANNSGGSGGCATATKSSDAQKWQLGAFAGLLGLSLVRRARKRRSSQK
ncbi:MAG: DUF2330 domain-containing protein [Polyangiaceae bacterium]